MAIAHPLARGWLTTGGTGAQNYDEFADDAEITAIIEDNPHSALAVEMPHRAPASLGQTFEDALPAAVERLQRAKADGDYTAADDVVVLYRIEDPNTGGTSYGMFCAVDTDQISTRDDEPGLVIRNEDVFVEKVRERVALADATKHLLSPVLLLQTRDDAQLQEALRAACESAGEPAARDQDHTGRTHTIWPLPPGERADALCALASAGELVVADGNHRSLAAQLGGLARFLAVVTTPESVTIQPYHRLVGELPTSAEDLIRQLSDGGAEVTKLPGSPATPKRSGVVHLYTAGTGYAVRFPAPAPGSTVDRMDHALVERQLLDTALGMEPGDKRVTYVGGDYPADWLCGEVDAGRAALAVLIAPVGVEDFVAVNLARQQMPRKSTWFTPKARAGLVLAETAGD